MNLINILFDRNELPENSLSLGGGLGLWDIARNKIITTPLYLIFVRQAKDKQLKEFLNTRIKTVQKQLGIIQNFFKEHGFAAPEEPNLDLKINDDSPFAVSSVILDDEEIALNLREHLRTILSLETEALRNATIPHERKLLYDILQADNKVYGDMLKIMKEKNWIDFPPSLLQQ